MEQEADPREVSLNSPCVLLLPAGLPPRAGRGPLVFGGREHSVNNWK